MAKHLIIRIIGWEKVNARKDVTNPSWFKFKHKFFDDRDFYEFSDAEKLSWIYILCEASKQNKSGLTTLYFDHAEQTAKLSAASIQGAIKKLKRLQIIEILPLRRRNADVTGAGVRQEKRREEEIREEKIRGNSWPVAVDAATQEAQAKLLRLREELSGTQTQVSGFRKAGS